MMTDLVIQFAALGCMGGCAIAEKVSLEIFFGFIFIAATIRHSCRLIRDNMKEK